jgi:hypothetical protein
MKIRGLVYANKVKSRKEVPWINVPQNPSEAVTIFTSLSGGPGILFTGICQDAFWASDKSQTGLAGNTSKQGKGAPFNIIISVHETFFCGLNIGR